mmetsp:Transcript_4859/g.12516  ORF Transcript_4859/g.12516 Transcript_4859/m.12516 type:complete len:471 (-) Transcript_4859:573-1985(-)
MTEMAVPTTQEEKVHAGALWWPLGLIVSLFFLWGALNNLNDVLIKQFTKAFTLQDWEAGLVQSAFYVGYFVGGLPAAKVSREYGYKITVIVGLAFFSVGCLLFFPVSRCGDYHLFLVCLYLIAFGLAFLECSANPWVVQLGEQHRAGAGTLALNVAQAFNPIGSVLGVLIGRFFILGGEELTAQASMDPAAMERYQRQESEAVGAPYLAIGIVVVVLAILFILTRFPGGSIEDDGSAKEPMTFGILGNTALRLAGKRRFVQGVLAQFFYVGAQVSVWSFIIRYVEDNIPGTEEQTAADFILLSLGIFVAGRFVAAALLKMVQDYQLLGAYAVAAALCCVIAALVGGTVGVVAVCATSFFMSMMFPTLFGLALEALDGEDNEIGASFVVMAIVGGAAAPPVMGFVSDKSSMTTAYLVPGCCFLVIAAHSLNLAQQRASTKAAEKAVSEDGSEVSSRGTEVAPPASIVVAAV